MFFKKATKFDEIFTIDLTLCSICQIDGEYFVLENINFISTFKKAWFLQKILSSQEMVLEIVPIIFPVIFPKCVPYIVHEFFK